MTKRKLIVFCAAVFFLAACRLGSVIPAVPNPLPPDPSSPTRAKAPTIAPTVAPTTVPGLSIIGSWERHGKQDTRTYTELLIFQADGSYSIRATFDDTQAILAENSGTYTFDSTTITYTSQAGKVVTEQYALDASGNKLVMNNDPATTWVRIGK
jgi:hypothetical protein